MLNAEGASDIVLICEHASNHMPAEYDGLGLSAADRERHIAWDIGTEALARGLAARLDAVCFLGRYSRLLIDLNRPLESPTSIPLRSEATVIPGNQRLPAGEKQRRAERIFTPFHTRISHHLDGRATARRRTLIVAIHSFTPVYFGRGRLWHAGILFDGARELARRVIGRLAADPSLVIGANQPYVIDRMEDYAVPIHGEDRQLPAILVEVRQDLLASPAGIADWVGRLENALAGL